MAFLSNSATISANDEDSIVTAPLTGYADKNFVRVGEKISFKISSAGLLSPLMRPGPGVHAERVCRKL